MLHCIDEDFCCALLDFQTPCTLVSGPICLKLYKSNNSLIVGCPGADTTPASSAPKVRNPPNLAQSMRDIRPPSPMTIPIVGTCNFSQNDSQSLNQFLLYFIHVVSFLFELCIVHLYWGLIDSQEKPHDNTKDKFDNQALKKYYLPENARVVERSELNQ